MRYDGPPRSEMVAIYLGMLAIVVAIVLLAVDSLAAAWVIIVAGVLSIGYAVVSQHRRLTRRRR